MAFTADQGAILIKKEATYGTDPVPVAATDAIEISDVNVSIDGRLIERPLLTAELGRAAHIVGRKLITLEFTTEIKGSGTNDVPPRWSPLLEACQFAETINAATSVEYDLVNTALDSATVYVYLGDTGGGIVYKVLGCYVTRGLITLTAGDLPQSRWTLLGLYAGPTDAAVPSQTFDATLPVQVESIGLTIDSVSTFVINEFSIDMAVNTAERPDVNGAEGLAGILSGKRTFTGSIDPELETVATYNWWTKFAAGTEVVLTASLGTVAGNIIDFDADKVQYGVLGHTNRNTVRANTIPVFFNRGGTNELKVTQS